MKSEVTKSNNSFLFQFIEERAWWLIIIIWILAILIKFLPLKYSVFENDPILKIIIENLSLLFLTIGISIFIYTFLESKIKKIDNEISLKEQQYFNNKIIALLDESRVNIESKQSEIFKNLHASIFERFVDEKIYDTLVKDFFSANLVRRNLKITFQISEIDDGYEIKQNTSYDAENICSGNETTEEDIVIPKEFENNDNGSRMVVMMKNKDIWDKKDNWFTVFSNIKNNKVDINNEGNIESYRNIHDELRYRIKVEAKSKVSILTSIRRKYNTHNLEDKLFTSQTMIGCEIIVIKPQDCEFKLNPTFKGVDNVQNFGGTELRYKPIPVILLGQGIHYSVSKVIKKA